MKSLAFAAALCLGVSAPALAAAGEPVFPHQGWDAVGRLTFANRSMCTGALIAPDTVLTAAHCLYDPRSGKPIDPARIRFEAGLQKGRAKAVRMVSRAVEHPAYDHARRSPTMASTDIAVLKLATPIGSAEIRPLAVEARPIAGETLGVVSYTHARADAPLLQHPCDVLARKSDTLVMNCAVDFGASGAPVFAVRGDRVPRLVSVISAKAEMGNRQVSVGTMLDSTLRLLLRQAG